jgi:hypothetical protein
METKGILVNDENGEFFGNVWSLQDIKEISINLNYHGTNEDYKEIRKNVLQLINDDININYETLESEIKYYYENNYTYIEFFSFLSQYFSFYAQDVYEYFIDRIDVCNVDEVYFKENIFIFDTVDKLLSLLKEGNLTQIYTNAIIEFDNFYLLDLGY